jgi:23S rRNA pseudouridine2605 synthase
MKGDPVRLNRYLASCGHGSRRSCDELIRSGRVTVNGGIVTDLATRVGPGDVVAVDGRTCRQSERVVLMLHKPKGVICSKVDLADRPTVFQLLPPHLPQLFYVGRLDVDSEGLLLMTNDGDLAERISHPRNKLPKVYEVVLDRPFDMKLRAALIRGVETEFGFGRMESVDPLPGTRVRVVLCQGLKRQVRLMFRKVGFKVLGLKRTQIGGLKLGTLKPGQWRMLEPRDMKALDAVDLQSVTAQRPIFRKEKVASAARPSSRARQPSLKSRQTDLERASWRGRGPLQRRRPGNPTRPAKRPNSD